MNVPLPVLDAERPVRKPQPALRSGAGRAVVRLLDRAVVPLARRARAHRLKARAAGDPFRSLWLGPPLPTLPVKAKAERLLGYESETMVFGATWVGGRFDHQYESFRHQRLGPLAPYEAFLRILRRFDRIHTFFDRGLLPQRATRAFNPTEISLLRKLGIEVFAWTYGADVRTIDTTLDLGDINICRFCPEPGRFCVCDDTQGAENARYVVENTNASFSMGDMIPYTPGARTDAFFWPIDLEAPAPDGDGLRYEPAFPDPDRGERPLRLAHAPNNRAFKGTDIMLAAVERLQGRGIKIEVDLIERVPNAEALARFRAADAVFDQCVAGYHGYTTHESMALGKPVLAFVRDPDVMLIDHTRCPIINASPGELEHQLERLATEPDRAHKFGREGRVYIEQHYTPDVFAERLRGIYQELHVGQVDASQ